MTRSFTTPGSGIRTLAIVVLAAASSLLAVPALAAPAAAAPKPNGPPAKGAPTKGAPTKGAPTNGAPTNGAPTSKPASAASTTPAYPATPPAAICGNTSLLTGPSTAPPGAIVVAAGDNSTMSWNQPGATFYFATGTHTLGRGIYSQIISSDHTTYIGAPGAVIDGQGINNFAFTQAGVGVTIRYLTVQNFVSPQDQGVVNHDSGPNWTIQYNTIVHNAGAGVMVGPGDVVSYNCLASNGQYGFNAYKAGGDSNITLDHNEIAGNNTGNWAVASPGCGCAGAGKLWRTVGATITNNWVHNNMGPGIWADANNAGILIDGNYIADNEDEAIIYEISYNAQITNNTIVRNDIVKGKALAAQGSSFPAAAIYISESGGDARVDGGLYATFNISGNNLVDNWGGVILWEDTNRFCGADPTFSVCTLGDPAATVGTCAPGTINSQPYLGDCRWKTQNVSVHDNQFSFSRANVGCTTTGCGEQAILASTGTAPSWSPYLGTTGKTAITTQQNNHFATNSYTGDWQFDWSGLIPITFTQWQGGPNNQDIGSTLNGVTFTPPPAGNLLDADSASFEGSVGHWVPWYSAALSQTATQAQTGTHSLQVDVTAPWGWAVQLNNAPGFTATPGAQTIGFWGLAGVGALGADMQVQWRNSGGTVLATNDVAIPSLTTAWKQASANVTAPAGTAFVTMTFSGPGASGVAGDRLFLDQIFVGATTGPGPGPGGTPGVNLLDTDSATLEKSAGHWAPWFNTTAAQTAAQAQTGTHSLLVGVTGSSGWGIQLNNWPGFAAAPGLQSMSFWALAGGGAVGITMQTQWRDGVGNVLGTGNASLAVLNSTWQQARADVVAPPGTASVTVTFTGAAGAGSSLYLDQIIVGPAAAPPPPAGVNALDADTASLEGSTGHWAPWFSATVAQTTAQAEAGTHSLQVQVTAPFGWGIQVNSWPGFATSPGPQAIGFWALGGVGSLGVTMQVQWRDGAGHVLGTNSAAIPALTGGWQHATASATAPAGTVAVTASFSGTTATAGSSIYLDEIYVGT